MDRRGFLIAAAGAATLPVVGRLPGRAAAAGWAGSVMPPLGLPDAQEAGAELSLEMLTHRPLNAQTPFAAMRSWRTPNDLFYVRSHFGAPAQVPEQWTLTIDGEVERPLTLTLEDIESLPSVTRPVVLECAGNGRGQLDLASTSGVQWTYGAVSNAE